MMKAIVLVAVGLMVAACSASTPRAQSASNTEGGWEGDTCSQNNQCNTLWCVNGRCARPEP